MMFSAFNIIPFSKNNFSFCHCERSVAIYCRLPSNYVSIFAKATMRRVFAMTDWSIKFRKSYYFLLSFLFRFYEGVNSSRNVFLDYPIKSVNDVGSGNDVGLGNDVELGNDVGLSNSVELGNEDKGYELNIGSICYN